MANGNGNGGCDCDVTVIGAGPAGLCSAIYASSEGLRVTLVDGGALGGQAASSSLIENYPGFPAGLTGSELAGLFSEQVKKFGARIMCPVRIDEIKKDGNIFILTTDDESVLRCKVVVLALGVSYVRLDAEGIDSFGGGRGVSYGQPGGATMGDGNHFVVGGANSAGQAALALSRNGSCDVTMLLRGDSLEARMSDYLVKRILQTSNITVLKKAQILSAHGNGKLSSLTIKVNDETKDYAAAGLHIYIGAKPKTRIVRDVVVRDPHGFILTGQDTGDSWKCEDRKPFQFETSCNGMFAIGDVRSGSTKRVVNAVGEGGVVTSQIHQYLAMLKE